MEQPTCIYSRQQLSITVSRTPSSAAVMLLQKTTYGTNGPRYSHAGHEKKILRIVGPYFFELRQGQELLGMYCLSERLIQMPVGRVTGFYGRYLAIGPAHSGQGYGTLLKQEAIRYIDDIKPEPHVFYSYIEASNEASVKISAREGFTTLAQLEALVFGRLYPKQDPRVSRLPVTELSSLLALLKTAYQQYSFVQFNHVYAGQNYFVLRENGEIIAGVQANPALWRIVEMPKLSGKIMLNVLPHVPVLKRIINPKEYAFAALEAVYTKPGREQELFPLLESVLAHFQITSTLIMLDVNAPLSQQLKKSGKLGILNSLKKSIYSQVMVKLKGLREQDVKQSPQQPLYTSAFDYT